MNPLRVLATELARRGVPDVWFATDEYRRPDIEGISGTNPVEFASLGETIPERSAETWDERTYRAVTQANLFKAHQAQIEQGYDPSLQAAKYRALESAADKIQPALMVIDSMCQYGIDLAITKGIPYVLSTTFLPSVWLTSYFPFGKSYTSPWFPVPNSGLPRDMTIGQQLANQLFRLRTMATFGKPKMLKVLAREHRGRRELGIAPEARRFLAKADRAELILCYSVPELEYPFRYPDTLLTVGAMLPPLPEAADDGGHLTAWLDRQDSVVYMGLGTVTRLSPPEIRSMVEVARRLEGRHSVLWKLPLEQQEFLPPAATLPGNLRIETWLPSQHDVLAHPKVTVFFTHGGGNGFHESLRHGKPMVIRPLWADGPDQAVRGQERGVSLTLDRPHDLVPDDVTDKLTRVLRDGSFRTRAEYFRDLMRAAGGRCTAADRLLGLPALA
ncbi:polyene glycosyltransferase [Amycolatopsis cihanbeyliensis]|uniref:Polyene glycosyltransferase n=2 Tax=Amycolatopsis cihanbeyliensis TaxID=1128664 RepID=A0A542CSC0_AMYCI|nr:polyene glycosyltransferase [Amycolatopsis cihanbeyliensis]